MEHMVSSARCLVSSDQVKKCVRVRKRVQGACRSVGYRGEFLDILRGIVMASDD